MINNNQNKLRKKKKKTEIKMDVLEIDESECINIYKNLNITCDLKAQELDLTKYSSSKITYEKHGNCTFKSLVHIIYIKEKFDICVINKHFDPMLALETLSLLWNLLEIGGIIILYPQYDNTGIKGFLNCHKGQYELQSSDHIMLIIKGCSADDVFLSL
jgi:hypothetical protein